MPFTLPRSITVDFSTDADPQPIKAVQGDQTRVAKITLLNKGVPLNLTGLTVRAYVMPFGETVGLYEDVAVTDATAGKVEYSLSGNACIKAGDGVVNIELLETATGKLAHTDEIPLKVKAKKDFVGAIIGSTAFSALQSALAQIDQIGTLASLLTTAKTNLVAAINELFTKKMNLAGGSANPFTAMPYVGTAPIVASGAGYVKYADGTMICWGSSILTSTPNASGSIFYSAELILGFPAAFYVAPFLFTSAYGTDGVIIGSRGYGSTVGGAKALLIGSQATNNGYVNWTAFGRWKA